MLTQERLIRLCDARNKLRDPQHVELSIAAIATSVAMSRFHFIRQFKALFGETPQQYRTRSRLEMAKHLLATSEDSITDICMAIGFSSLGSFSTLFARQFGQAPSKYRQRLAGTAPLTPDCMALLQAAWKHDSQISRSQDKPK